MIFVLLGSVLGFVLVTIKFLLTNTEVPNMSKQTSSAPKKSFGESRNQLIHDVILANTHLISDKLLGILAYILGDQADEHGLLSVVFSPEYPKKEKGENLISRFLPDARCMVVNLDGHLELTEEVIREANNFMAVWPYLWMQIIKSFWHELHHAHTFSDAANIYDVDTSAADFENKAEDWCNEMMVEMAKVIDIEPPALEDFPYYTDWMYDILGGIGDGRWEEPWAEHQLDMMGEGLCFFKPGIDGKYDPIRCITLRDYLRMVSGDQDPKWNAPVQGMAGLAEAVKEPELVMEVVDPNKVAAESTVSPKLEVIKPDLSKPAIVVSGPAVAAVVVGDEPEFTVEMMDGQMFNPEEDDDGAEAAFDGVTIIDDAGAAVPTSPPAGSKTLQTNVTIKPLVKTEVAAPPQPIQLRTETVTAQPGGGAVDVGNIVGTTGLPVPAKPQAPVLQLTPHGLGKQEMLTCLQAILITLYSHMFNKCGWDGVGGFTNTAAILEPVSLAHIPNADKILVSCNTVVNGARVPEQKFEGTVAGIQMLEGRSCGYHLTFNQGGMKSVRTFKAVDALACHASGELKDWSKKAQAGHMIGMMLDDKGVKAKVSTIPGQGCTYEFGMFG